MKTCHICNQEAGDRCSICRAQICSSHGRTVEERFVYRFGRTAEKRIVCTRCAGKFVQDGKIKIKTSLLEWILYIFLCAVSVLSAIIYALHTDIIPFPPLVVKISATMFWSSFVYLAIIFLFFIEHLFGKPQARISLSQEFWRSYGVRGYIVTLMFYYLLIFSVWMMIVPWIFETIWHFLRFNVAMLSIYLFSIGFIPLLIGFVVSVSIWRYKQEKNRKKKRIAIFLQNLTKKL